MHALRASDFKPSPKSGFAVGNVEAIRDICTERTHKIRIIHAPTDDNAAHCEIRQMPREDIELLELLAASTWAELHLNKDIAAGNTPAPAQPATNPWP